LRDVSDFDWLGKHGRTIAEERRPESRIQTGRRLLVKAQRQSTQVVFSRFGGRLKTNSTFVTPRMRRARATASNHRRHPGEDCYYLVIPAQQAVKKPCRASKIVVPAKAGTQGK
jgi:hypothetical protein